MIHDYNVIIENLSHVNFENVFQEYVSSPK